MLVHLHGRRLGRNDAPPWRHYNVPVALQRVPDMHGHLVLLAMPPPALYLQHRMSVVIFRRGKRAVSEPDVERLEVLDFLRTHHDLERLGGAVLAQNGLDFVHIERARHELLPAPSQLCRALLRRCPCRHARDDRGQGDPSNDQKSKK